MPDPTSQQPPLPTQLGEFRVESVLGEGGSGTVYAAHWGHREVALKVLRDAWLPSDGERRRFLDEARLLADVNHPGVVRILGFGKLPDGRPYLAMERLEGESLADRLGRGALAVERALELFDQLCQAVSTLHARGLIHRDIKPENVFLVREERYAVLLDFGIAKPVDAPDSTVTREGGVRGTPAYMAPERFFGASANAATDIYELGVVLYAMLNGRLPWDGSNDPVTRLNPRRPSELGTTLPGDLEGVLLSALASRPESRPATVDKLAAFVARSVREPPSSGGARRTADLPTSAPSPSAASTSPASRPQVELTVREKGLADVAIAPTIRVTPPGTTARSTADPIASYWSDSNPSIVLDELDPTGPGPASAGAPGPDNSTGPTRQATGPIRAATLGVGLPTADGTTTIVQAARRRRHRALLWGGGLLVLVLGLVGVVYLATRPARDRPLSVGAVGLVRPPEPTPRRVAPPGRRPIALGRDKLIWRTHPKDTEVLARLSHDQLMGSDVYKILTQKTNLPLKIPQLGIIRRACKLDLLAKADWVSIGWSGRTGSRNVDFMIRGDWTRQAVEQCLASLGQTAGLASIMKRHGPVTRANLGTSTFWIGWPDDRTLFLSNRDIANQQWVTDRLQGKEPAREAPHLRRLYNEVNTSATAWLIISSTRVVPSTLFQEIPRPQTLSLSLWVKSSLRFDTLARYNEAKAALQARDAVRIEIHKIKQNVYVNSLLSSAVVSGADKELRLSVLLEPASAQIFAEAIAGYLESTNLSTMKPGSKPPTEGKSPP